MCFAWRRQRFRDDFCCRYFFPRTAPRSGEVQTAIIVGAEPIQELWHGTGWTSGQRFMLFLVIFSGYWIVYWQEFLTLPIYVHDYINPKADTAFMLGHGPILVIAFTVLIGLPAEDAPFRAITLGTLVSALAWIVLIIHPTVLWPMPRWRCSFRRDHSFAALLRIRLSPRSTGTARHLHGLCVSADWNRLACRRMVWRKARSIILARSLTSQHIWWAVIAVGVLTALLCGFTTGR